MKTIYTGLVLCSDQGIAEVNALHLLYPGTNSTIYQVHFRHQRTNWVKLQIH
jgi:hypothetical protein